VLWLKAFHIFFVVSWFAGLFYLPRLYVNHAMVEQESEERVTVQRLLTMERKLFRFMTPIGILAVVLGLWLWFAYFPGAGAWMHLKLLLVILLVGYHAYCGKLLHDFERGRNTRSHRWYRVFNELPVLLLLGSVLLVVLKPFQG
jgi:protoporphyrinogen IX oxidase